MTTFSAQTYQNEYLPEGGSQVDAVVTVTASGVTSPLGAADRYAYTAAAVPTCDTVFAAIKSRLSARRSMALLQPENCALP